MEKLSIEEKAKAYDEALKRAKILYNDKNEIGYANAESVLEEVFPLLKEPEDERIRKALIEYFGEQCDMSDWNGVYGYQVVAWLEKQGEQKPAWSEEDEEHYKACLQYFDEVNPDMVYYKDYQWLKSLKQRIGG